MAHVGLASDGLTHRSAHDPSRCTAEPRPLTRPSTFPRAETVTNRDASRLQELMSRTEDTRRACSSSFTTKSTSALFRTASPLYGKCCSVRYTCRSQHVKNRIGHRLQSGLMRQDCIVGTRSVEHCSRPPYDFYRNRYGSTDAVPTNPTSVWLPTLRLA